MRVPLLDVNPYRLPFTVNHNCIAFVARVERSDTLGSSSPARKFPGIAALHPGYVMFSS